MVKYRLRSIIGLAVLGILIGAAALMLAQFDFTDKLSAPPSPCNNFTFLQTFGGNSTICNTVPLQGTLSFFFTNQTSVNTQNDSKRMLSTPDNATTTVITYSGLSDGQNFQNWTTKQGLPEISFIPGGIYFIHIHASSNKPGFSMIFAEVWEVNNTGVLIQQIGTTEHEILDSNVETEYDMEFSRNTTVFLNSTQSRIQVRFFVHVLQDTPDLTLYFDGATNARLSLPSVTVDASNFVPYNGATQDVNLSTHNITANQGGFTNVIGDGSKISAINANNISTGTLSDTRLNGSVLLNYTPHIRSVSTSHVASSTVNQTITGVGFKPSYVSLIMSDSNLPQASWGDSDGVSNFVTYSFFDGSKTVYGFTGDNMGFYVQTTANIAKATFINFTDDGMTLNWTKTGTPTDTITMRFTFYR